MANTKWYKIYEEQNQALWAIFVKCGKSNLLAKKKTTNYDLASTILFKTQNNKKNITYIFITLLLYIYIKNVKKKNL